MRHDRTRRHGTARWATALTGALVATVTGMTVPAAADEAPEIDSSVARIISSGTSDTEIEPVDPGDVPTGKVTTKVVTMNGSGCPTGTASVAISPDNEAFTVTYSQYFASTAASLEQACQLTITVNAPGGFSYSVVSSDYRGFADLADGARGTLRGTYYFTGESPTADTVHTFTGPMLDDWQVTDEVPEEEMVWEPCGAERNLNIKTRLMVSAGTSTGVSRLTMDSHDVAFSTKYNFVWASC